MAGFTPDELVRWCQRTLPDDPCAFEALVAQYKQRVFGLAYRLMGNRQDAEDQAQEAFLKVYRGITSLHDPQVLPSWIDRVTVRTCLDALDKQKRRPATISLPLPDRAEDQIDWLVAPLATPEETALQHELRACLEQTLAELDAAERAAIVLRDIEDRPYNEMTELLGISLSAVKMRIHRARLAFQQLLDALCPDAWRASSSPHT